MVRMKKATWLARSLAGIAVLTLVAAACGDETPPTNTGPVIEGSLNITGSSTVEPITSLVAEKFQSANPGVTPAVDNPGTSDGFALFCNGEADINDASRQIEQEEIDACAANGIEYIELEIGQDALSVIGNPANPISCLTTGDIYALFGPESGGFATWSDANGLAQEVGGTGGFPDQPLTIVAPGEESGTYGSFIDLTGTEDVALDRGVSEDQAASLRNYQISADDNVIVENAAGTESGLGFVGYAYTVNSGGSIKAFEIDAGDGCVAPSPETVQDGSYPLARSLYIYVSKQRLADNPALQPFVDFYLSDEGMASVTEKQYVGLPADRLEATRSAWDAGKA